MKTRILTAMGIVAFLLPFVFLSHTVLYPIIVSLLSFIAAYEVLKCFNLEKKILPSCAAYLISAGLPVLAYIFKENLTVFFTATVLSLFGCMIYFFALAVFCHAQYKYSELASAYVMLLYVVVAFSAMSLIRNIEGVGFILFMLIFIVAWLTDVFAYFTGFLFGKHKLAPVISPKKTIEGAIGGTVFGAGSCFLFAFIVTLIDASIGVNYVALAIFAPILSIISQIGDLFASAVKRERGIKDYGYLLPGHGGILDRFDSIIAITMPLLAMSYLFPIFFVIK